MSSKGQASKVLHKSTWSVFYDGRVPWQKSREKSNGSSLLVFLVSPRRLRIPLNPIDFFLSFSLFLPLALRFSLDSWRILMHSTCAIWQCRPVYRRFIVGPKGSRPNRQKFLYLHSCVFITPLPPSRYVVRSMNLNCDLRSSLLRRDPLWKRSRTTFRRERSCHEWNTVVKNLNFQKEFNATKLRIAKFKKYLLTILVILKNIQICFYRYFIRIER